MKFTRRSILLVLVIALVAVADTASALCVFCEQVNCTKFNGKQVSATVCGAPVDDGGPGVQNCKNVAGCGGCMGFSCQRAGEVPLSVVLLPQKTVVAFVPRTAQTSDHSSK